MEEKTEIKKLPIYNLIPLEKINAIEYAIRELESGAKIERIDTESQLLAANELLATVEKNRRRIEALRVEFVGPHSYNVDVVNQYFKAYTNDNKNKPGTLDTLKKSISDSIINFNNRQRIKAEEEARQKRIEAAKIEEEARKRREEEDRKRLEAEQARQRAQQAANEEERKRLEAEAAKLEKSADKDAQQAEKKENQAVQVALTPTETAPVKLEGASTRTTYSANVKDHSAFFAWIAKTGNFFLVSVNQSALNKKASTEKEYFNVEGCELVKEQTLVKRV